MEKKKIVEECFSLLNCLEKNMKKFRDKIVIKKIYFIIVARNYLTQPIIILKHSMVKLY